MNTADTGKFISAHRKEKGLTQRELAERLNVTDKAVSKWETGRGAPDISLLVPLAEILGVTVIELLQGERIEEESFPEISNEVIVDTMKKDRLKTRKAVAVTVLIMLMLISFLLLSCPVYHYLTSVPADDENAVLRQSGRYAEQLGEAEEEMKIIKSVKKGDYFFYLLHSDNKTSMRVFKADSIFDGRISLIGGGACREPNEVNLYCTSDGLATLNVFYGYGMTDTEYSYYYRGVRCTKPIKEDTVLDVTIDIDDSWTHAVLIYDE